MAPVTMEAPAEAGAASNRLSEGDADEMAHTPRSSVDDLMREMISKSRVGRPLA